MKSDCSDENRARLLAGKHGAAIPGYESNPILMDDLQTMSLINESGKAKVIAVHMDALDHCRTTRAKLAQKAADLKIGKDKLRIPQDGELIYLSR